MINMLHNQNAFPEGSKIHPINMDIVNFPSITTTGFQYGIGEVFYDEEGDIAYEITGYNIMTLTYKAKVYVTMKNDVLEFDSHVIYESTLSRLARYNSLSEFLNRTAIKADKICYRIHFFDLEQPQKRGQSANYTDVKLPNVRALAKLLNSMVKVNPKRRIVMVTIVNDGQYVTHVRLLTKEIKEQKFLTGMKERLLAHAKYKCGYEIATSF